MPHLGCCTTNNTALPCRRSRSQLFLSDLLTLKTKALRTSKTSETSHSVIQQKNERIYTSTPLYAFRACARTPLPLPLHNNSYKSPTNCFWISDPCCELRYSSYIHLYNLSVGRTMQTKRKGMRRCGTAFSCHVTRGNIGHRAVSACRFWMPIITDVTFTPTVLA
jgi:hypothetical protein